VRTTTAAAGINPVTEDAVITGGAVIDLPAASVVFTPGVGAVVKVRTLYIYEAEASVHLFGAVQILGGAGITDMLTRAEQAVFISVAELIILAALA
jgi:hypothetical protein